MSRVAGKRDFKIDIVIDRVRKAVQPFPKAGLFELADYGFTTVFQQLVACIISIRTTDDMLVPTARRLFEVAQTPAAVRALGPADIDRLIHGCAFHEAKSRQIHTIARWADERDGQIPCEYDTLTGFGGVGPKCANLVLGLACGQARIGVDIHVHRVTNRWGFVAAPNPEATMAALEKELPRRYWLEINRLLVPFGKHICTGKLPHCSTCPVLAYCWQVGVDQHR